MLLTDYRAALVAQLEGQGPENLSSDLEVAIRQIALRSALSWYDGALDTNDHDYDRDGRDFVKGLRPMLLKHQGTHAKWVDRRCSVSTALLAGRHDFKDYEGNGSCCRLLCPSCAIYRNFRFRAATMLAPPGVLYARFQGYVSFELPWTAQQLYEWKVDRRQLSLLGWCEYAGDNISITPDGEGERELLTFRSRQGYWWSPDEQVSGASSLPENALAIKHPDTQVLRRYAFDENQLDEAVYLSGTQAAVTTNGPAELILDLDCLFDPKSGTQHPIQLARHPVERLHRWHRAVLIAESFKTRACRFASKIPGL